MKNIYCYLIRYAISLNLHQSNFKNKGKCDIAVTRLLFCTKKITLRSFDCCCYFNSYIESNLTCVIKSKQNLLFESKCMLQTHLKIISINQK